MIARTSLAFGLAQFIMPILGWLAGTRLLDIISGYDHWLAFGLLSIVGGRMVWEGRHQEPSARNFDISRGWLLFTLAVATSIDSLAVGLSFAFLRLNILFSSSIIGVTAFIVTIIGFTIGRRIGTFLGQWAKFGGGILLIGIGIRVLITHLSGS